MLTAKTRTRAPSRRGWILLFTGFFAAGLVAALQWLLPFAPGPQGATAEPPPCPGGEILMATVQMAEASGAQRGDAMLPPAPVEARTFEQQIEHLVGLGEATAAAVQDDEIEQAKAADRDARDAFASLMQQFADAGERAVAMLAGLPPDSAQHVHSGRIMVLRLVIEAECARLEEAAAAAQDRSRIDPFVGALLMVMPQGKRLADLGEAVLADQPYLQLVHEPAVADLFRLASEGQVPQQTATRLLLTLWDNLLRSGERTASELASQAMLLLADRDPGKRTAACRQLLRDSRYRHVVLAWLREHQDLAVGGEVMALAAQELPPRDALAVLRELAPTLPDMPAAYMALAHRAPDVLVDAYHELLATNTHPAVRRDLIAGLAMARTTESTPAVELALQSDPAPEVRLQAMLSLTATAAASCGEDACHRVLDDPVLGRDPARLAVVVFALQNLEAAGLTNAVDRLGQQLRNTPLRDDSRRALELLLARALPDGRTSR